MLSFRTTEQVHPFLMEMYACNKRKAYNTTVKNIYSAGAFHPEGSQSVLQTLESNITSPSAVI